nr:PREDICTED: uncharacterized protein LOC109043967 [Bemisia tabaci]
MSDKGFEEVMKQNYLRTVKELVCPGCDERLLRWPVRTCILGHGVCRLCRDQMKLCPVCNLPLVNEKSKVLDKFLRLLYDEYAKLKIDTRIKATAPTTTPKVMARKPPVHPPVGYRRRNRQTPPGGGAGPRPVGSTGPHRPPPRPLFTLPCPRLPFAAPHHGPHLAFIPRAATLPLMKD